MQQMGKVGGISITTPSRALVVNLDNMRQTVLTRCYLRFQIGLWVFDLLIRLGPVRAECGAEVKHGHLAVTCDLCLIWSHR